MATSVAIPADINTKQKQNSPVEFQGMNNAQFTPAGQTQVPPPQTMTATAPPTAASLYVGDLLPDMTEAALYETFNSIGPVASIRVCRDAVTKNSLGYAYVNFHSIIDAEQAMEHLNHASINGRPCRIMFSQRDPTLRKNGVGNIFIKNLEDNIDNKALYDTFASFGPILSCKVATDASNNSKGYGFVHYEKPEYAEKAIQEVNGMLLNDKKVFVGLHVPKEIRESRINEIRANFTNVFIKELDPSVLDSELNDMFSPFGEIISAAVAKNDDGTSKTFGFVNFKDHEAAEQAVDAMNGKSIEGKKLYVARAQKKTERQEVLRRRYEQAKQEKIQRYHNVNVYVKNLEDDIDDAKLQALFSSYGDITSAKVMKDEKGNSKGFGFVCFSNPDEAAGAVADNQGKLIGTKPLYVNFAQRKEERRNLLEQQRHNRQFQQAVAMAPGMPPGVNHGALGLPAPMGLYGGPGPVYLPTGANGMPMGRIPQYFTPPNVVNRRWQGAPPQHQIMNNRQNGFMVSNMAQGNVSYHPGTVLPGARQIPPQGASPQANVRQVRRQHGSNNQGGGNNQKNNFPPPQFGIPPHQMMMNQHMQPMPNVQQNQNIPRRGTYKFAPTARNNKEVIPLPQSNTSNIPPLVQQSVDNLGGYNEVPLNPSVLATYAPHVVKEMLGEALYKRVHKWMLDNGHEQDLAGVPKITGMLLSVDTSEILNFLDSANSEDLNQQISEALAIWQEHSQHSHEQQFEGEGNQ